MSGPIGGYFELELHKGKEYHPNAIKLNTGRNAFECILNVYGYDKVYIPFFVCNALIETLIKCNVTFEFYSINEVLEPIFDYTTLEEDEAFLYVNYFGVKDDFVRKLSVCCGNLIVDNAQAFFSERITGATSFYSARKFLGVPDGAYLYCDKEINLEWPIDRSDKRFDHLLNRIEGGAESGYKDFLRNEILLRDQPICRMSLLTMRILQSIDYESIKFKRRSNFDFLHSILGSSNKLEMNFDLIDVPMVYPLVLQNSNLKSKLIENKIFLATYWPDVKDRAAPGSLEFELVENMLAIPVDQRYEKNDMQRIIDLI